MSLYEPFGVGSLKIGGSAQPVEDRVVLNDACKDPTALFKRPGDHPTVPDFLQQFEKKTMSFARAPSLFPSPIERAFFQGNALMACEAQWDGVPHYFLGQRLRRLLRENDRSVVRNYGQWCHVVLDTRTNHYEFHAPPIKRTDPEECRQEMQGYDGLATDHVTPRGGLVWYPDGESQAVLIGISEPGLATPALEYFRTLGKEARPPLEDGVAWSGALRLEQRLACAWRDTGHGLQSFLTREAYRHLETQGMVIFRATWPVPAQPPKEMSLIWTGPHRVAP